MHLTQYKPKIIVIGETLEQAVWYSREVIMKKEKTIRFCKTELETEDRIYILKGMNIDYLRGYRVKEVWLVGTASINKILDIGHEHLDTLRHITFWREGAVKEVKE